MRKNGSITGGPFNHFPGEPEALSSLRAFPLGGRCVSEGERAGKTAAADTASGSCWNGGAFGRQDKTEAQRVIPRIFRQGSADGSGELFGAEGQVAASAGDAVVADGEGFRPPVGIVYPFHDVSFQVVQAQVVGRKGFYGGRIRLSVVISYDNAGGRQVNQGGLVRKISRFIRRRP